MAEDLTVNTLDRGITMAAGAPGELSTARLVSEFGIALIQQLKPRDGFT